MKITRHLSEPYSDGFTIELDNGFSVSVQMGGSDGKTAETAIIDPEGKFVSYKGDDVQGYQTLRDVLTTIKIVNEEN